MSYLKERKEKKLRRNFACSFNPVISPSQLSVLLSKMYVSLYFTEKAAGFFTFFVLLDISIELGPVIGF